MVVEQMTKKKILIYDSWPNLFDVLDSIFKVYNNIEVHYLCNSKLYLRYSNEFYKSRFKESDVLYHDFEDYDYNPLKACKILDIDLVLFISIHNPEQRYFNFVIRKEGYKTILLMHGVINKDSIINKTKGGLGNKIERIPYIIFFLWKLFSRAQFHHKLKVLLEFFILFTKPASYKNNPILKESVQIDLLLYCNDYDVEFYRKYTNKSIKHFKIVSLDYLLYNAESSSKDVNKAFLNKDKALFFSQPIKDLNISEIKYEKVLKDLFFSLIKKGIALHIKEHPRQDYTLVDKLKEVGKEIRPIHKLIDDYNVYFSVNSTALMLPANLGYNTISLAPIFKVQALDNKRIQVVNSITELIELLDKVENNIPELPEINLEQIFNDL